MYLSAWRKGDLVKLPDGSQFRLTSDGYEVSPGKIVCDTDRGNCISYLTLIEEGILIETGSGRKNIKYK